MNHTTMMTGRLVAMLAAAALSGCALDTGPDQADDDGALGTAEQGITGTFIGTYKLRINATNADDWKALWWCVQSDGSVTKFDADTYPASSTTTRDENVTVEKCPTGKWKVSFQIKKNSNWRDLFPGAAVCATKWCGYHDSPDIDLIESPADQFQEFARSDQDWTNSDNKLCLVGINEWWDKVYVYKKPCG